MRFEEMRAQANIARPSNAVAACAAERERSSSVGFNATSASFGQTVVQAPHAMHNEAAKLRNQISDLHWRANPEAMGR